MSLIKTLAVIVLCINKSSAQNSLDLVAIDSYLNPYVRSGNFAGDVLVERNGRVIFERAYGFANREKRVRNNSTTRFHIASISMQFTAAAVLRLVDKGSISLRISNKTSCQRDKSKTSRIAALGLCKPICTERILAGLVSSVTPLARHGFRRISHY